MITRDCTTFQLSWSNKICPNYKS